MFFILQPWFCHFCKVTWKLLLSVWEHMNYWKRMFSICFGVLNPNIKSFLLLVQWKIIKHKIVAVLLLEPSFGHCCKVDWKLDSDMWEQMDNWKRVFFNCFDVLNPNIKSFFILVEWNIIKQEIISILVTWTIILSLQ